MAWTDKIKKLADSPKGREYIEKGRRELSKPQNQDKLRSLLTKLTGKKR